MSIHIDSEDVYSGYRYEGIWNLTSYVSGYFKVVEQYVDDQNIPWFINQIQRIFLTTADHSAEFALFTIGSGDLETYAYDDDLTGIADYIEARFNAVFAFLSESNTCTVTLNTVNQRFELHFEHPITLEYSQMSCNSVFELGTSNESGTDFYWSTKNITLHPHLYCKVKEINTKIDEPDITDGAFIFHTENNPLTGMRVSIHRPTKQFTISIYRNSIPNYTVPLRNKWDLILRKIT